MGRFTTYNESTSSKPKTIHPIWRGIGCLLIILIPILSYAGAVLLLQANYRQRWLPLPADLTRNLSVPYIGLLPVSLATIMTTVLLALLGFGILVILYSLAYRIAGPSQYSPVDAPPIRRKVKKSR